MLAKAPIRSRPSDRTVRVPGRQISRKAPSQSHRGSDSTPSAGNSFIMSVTPPCETDANEDLAA